MEFLGNWKFWLAVIIVALATNFIYNYVTKKGKLV